MRSGEIEIAARGGEDCLLLLRIDTVSSRFRKLMRFERFENCIADVGLRGNRPAGRVTLFVDFFDQAFRVLDQVVMAPIRHARRGPRKKALNRALLLRICLGKSFSGKLNIQIPRTGQLQRGGQINRQQPGGTIRFSRARGEIGEQRDDHKGEIPALHLLAVA